MSHSPTVEQAAIISAATSRPESLMIPAMAGTGKTTTLKMLASELPTKNILALAFNKKIAIDLEEALPPWVRVKTFNGLGHAAIASATGRRQTLDDNKISKLVTAHSKKLGGLSDNEWGNLRNLIRKAKSLGLVPARFPAAKRSLLSDDSFGWEIVADSLGVDLTEALVLSAREILSESISLALAGTIDFDDQLYISTLFTGLYQKFHTVICDESQDISALNRLQLSKSTGQRLIIAGDPKQAIYAFRGATADSMNQIKSLRPDWIDLPLTVTWRCPKAIVARQQSHAPGYTAAPEAPDGLVINLTGEKSWTIGSAEGTVMPNAVLCRNNAPLITLAFALLRKRIGIKVLGRDFGKSLTTLVKKIAGQSTSLEAFVPAFTLWKEKEVRLALAADKESKADRVTDQFESIMAVIEGLETPTTTELLFAIEQLFEKADGQIVLSSGHKAKGLEWNTVLHLDPWRIPSKWALRSAEDGNSTPLEQEYNLQYVTETRAKDTLILANLEQFV